MNNLETFRANVIALVEAVDPFIGRVFIADRRWNPDALGKNGAIDVDAVGLFDTGETDIGRRTRFWIVSTTNHRKPLTNATYELKGVVTLTAFFGWKKDDSESEKLRVAADTIVDQLSTKQAEFTDLAADMGDGYMGFLQELPQCIGPVRTAQLVGIGGQGHTVQIRASYFEEIAR